MSHMFPMRSRRDNTQLNAAPEPPFASMHNNNSTAKPPYLQLYDALELTATAFVNAVIARRASHQPDYNRLYEVAAPHFRISFAPASFTDHSPTLANVYDIAGFCELIQRMINNPSAWHRCMVLVADTTSCCRHDSGKPPPCTKCRDPRCDSRCEEVYGCGKGRLLSACGWRNWGYLRYAYAQRV